MIFKRLVRARTVAWILVGNIALLVALGGEFARATGVVDDAMRSFHPTDNTDDTYDVYKSAPRWLIVAIIATQDRLFYSHNGVNPITELGAVLRRLLGNPSQIQTRTISEQVATMLLARRSVPLRDPLRQSLVPLAFDHLLSNNEILALYLANVSMGTVDGSPVVGVRQGAEVYLDKKLSDLTLSECALLAAVVQHPSDNNPREHAEMAVAARNRVLDVLVENVEIDEHTMKMAQAEPLRVRAGPR